MKTVDGDVGFLEPSSQLKREQNVGELWVSIQKYRQNEIDGVQMVFVQRIHEGKCVSLRRNHNNSAGRWFLQQINQQMCQQKWPVMVRRHRQLDSINGHSFLKKVNVTSVVNQNINFRLRSINCRRKIANRLERRKIQFVNDDVGVASLANYFIWKLNDT